MLRIDNVVHLILLVSVLFGCKVISNREDVCGNSLPVRESPKDFGTVKDVVIIFEKGFKESNIKVSYLGVSVFDTVLSVNKTAGYSGQFVIKSVDFRKKMNLKIDNKQYRISIKKGAKVVQIERLGNNKLKVNYCNGIPQYY